MKINLNFFSKNYCSVYSLFLNVKKFYPAAPCCHCCTSLPLMPNTTWLLVNKCPLLYKTGFNKSKSPTISQSHHYAIHLVAITSPSYVKYSFRIERRILSTIMKKPKTIWEIWDKESARLLRSFNIQTK